MFQVTCHDCGRTIPYACTRTLKLGDHPILGYFTHEPALPPPWEAAVAFGPVTKRSATCKTCLKNNALQTLTERKLP